mmetsp:Transcript_32459/g.36998  ORF Transcript_32459/g.36998 Transcript_32459/m.36998 type:complete len:93 (+) Transcript_32459:381-659(+)
MGLNKRQQERAELEREKQREQEIAIIQAMQKMKIRNSTFYDSNNDDFLSREDPDEKNEEDSKHKHLPLRQLQSERPRDINPKSPAMKYNNLK